MKLFARAARVVAGTTLANTAPEKSVPLPRKEYRKIRLWRDVRRGVVDVYREIFGRLESDQVLDSTMMWIFFACMKFLFLELTNC